jgi:hypothetical protein
MKNILLPGILAVAVAASGGAAFAASDHSAMSNDSSVSAAKDSLTLTAAQRKTAWTDISKQAESESAPSNFTESVGNTVPSAVMLRPVPVNTANPVPALRPYDYARLKSQVLIVNPADKKIVDIIVHRA